MVFIPKPGKLLSQAKSLRPISLMSFVLKTLEKILDRHIRDGVLVKNHFTNTSMPTEQVCLQKPHSSRLYKDWKSL